MLKSPYPTRINADEGTGLRIQFDVDPQDKSDLLALLPQKGTIQLVLLNLLHNLANDLRELNIRGYRIDGSEILDILTSPRPLSDELIRRLRCTTVSTTQAIPTRLLQHSGGKRVREKVAGTKVKPSDSKE